MRRLRKTRIINIFIMLTLAMTLILLTINPVLSCDVAVVSGRVTPDGRPILWKNFDMSQYWHQQVQYFSAANQAAGGYYLLYHDNDSIGASSSAITPQSGVNEAGFSIAVAAVTESNALHEASNYNTHLLQDAVMNCATLADFENLLGTWPKSHSGHAISANYVAIDAQGGAALYECYTGKNLSSQTIMYKKYDANTGEVVDYQGNVLTPAQGDDFIGFFVRTNLNSYFPNNSGSERYIRANSLLTQLAAIDPASGTTQLSPRNIMRIVSKDVTGSSGSASSYSTTYCISRSQTRSGTVVEGVPTGGDPRLTVFWCALGEPAISVYVPTIVGAQAVSPYLFMDSVSSNGTVSDESDISVLNLAEDSRETYKSLIYSSNRGSAITGPYDSTINKNELAKVQQWTFPLEDTVTNNTINFLSSFRDNPALITPSSLQAYQEKCAKYVYDNYTAGSATAVPWE